MREKLNSNEYKTAQYNAIKAVWKTEEYKNNRLSEQVISLFSEKMSKIWSERYLEFTNALKISWENPERKREAKERLETKLNDLYFVKNGIIPK